MRAAAAAAAVPEEDDVGILVVVLRGGLREVPVVVLSRVALGAWWAAARPIGLIWTSRSRGEGGGRGRRSLGCVVAQERHAESQRRWSVAHGSVEGFKNLTCRHHRREPPPCLRSRSQRR